MEETALTVLIATPAAAPRASAASTARSTHPTAPRGTHTDRQAHSHFSITTQNTHTKLIINYVVIELAC